MRSTAVTTLNSWIEQTGLAGFSVFVEAEIFQDGLALENPNLRIEVGHVPLNIAKCKQLIYALYKFTVMLRKEK